MKIYIPIVCMLMLFSGCIFSGSDIEEAKVIEPYYILSTGSNHQLIAKEKGASTNKVIISSNIDSIGHYDNFIFGKTGGRYFIFDTETQNFFGVYNKPALFEEAKEKLNLFSEMESTY